MGQNPQLPEVRSLKFEVRSEFSTLFYKFLSITCLEFMQVGSVKSPTLLLTNVHCFRTRFAVELLTSDF